jgi:hypothetical protein
VSLFEHPGYLGFTSQGVIAIHAKWPVYPDEHGAGTALASLGKFPPGTRFEPIDDIDRCLLFFVHGYGEYDDLFDERAFHVAVWQEDLNALHEEHLVEGVTPLTHRMWEERNRQALRDSIIKEIGADKIPPGEDPLSRVGYLTDKREFRHVTFDSLDEYDDEFEAWAGVDREQGLRVTEAGWQALESILADQLVIPESVQPRIQVLLDAELYDTAVREMAVSLESTLRRTLDSELYGQRLVDAFVEQLTDPSRYIQARVKVLRGDLRTAFKFIRNEFAHRVIDLPRARALALISRLSLLLADVESINLNGAENRG